MDIEVLKAQKLAIAKAERLAKIAAGTYKEPNFNVDYTGFGTFTVKGKKYSGEGIQMRWKGQPTYEGFITSDKWVVVFPDGTKLAFNPKEDLAKDGSEECLTQSAFPD